MTHPILRKSKPEHAYSALAIGIVGELVGAGLIESDEPEDIAMCYGVVDRRVEWALNAADAARGE